MYMNMIHTFVRGDIYQRTNIGSRFAFDRQVARLRNEEYLYNYVNSRLEPGLVSSKL